MTPQRPERPLGVVLSALALGLAALVFLLLSLTGIAATLSGAHLPSGAGTAALPSAALLTVVMLCMTLLYLALAAWAIATLVGLLRMRSWARISTMVIAGCLIGLGFLSAVSLLATQSVVASGGVPVPPNVSPATLHKIFLALTVVSLVIAALGAAWLVYFALRRTRDAFARARAQQLATGNAYPPAAHDAPGYYPPGLYPPTVFPPNLAPTRTVPQRTPQPDPLTDFTVARPLQVSPQPPPPMEPDPAAPASSVDTSSPPEPPPWPGYAASPLHPSAPAATVAAARSGRPVSITILAALALLGAFFSLFNLVSPIPVFLFGAVLSGWPMHLFGLVWAAALAIAGLGMLRLQRPAWLLSFGLLGAGLLHFLVLLLPSVRARYVSYMTQVQQRTSLGAPQPALPASFLAMSIALGIFFGLALTVVAAILLWRARWAFAPPAPTTAADEPNAG